MITNPLSGSSINRPVPDFALTDHTLSPHRLKSVMGEGGVVLGFVGDIWKPASVHRILGLQRHAKKFALMGWPVALIVRSQAQTLGSFLVSSPLPVQFPLLADAEGKAHTSYGLEQRAALLLIDRDGMLRFKWQVTGDTIWPDMAEIAEAIHTLYQKK